MQHPWELALTPLYAFSPAVTLSQTICSSPNLVYNTFAPQSPDWNTKTTGHSEPLDVTQCEVQRSQMKWVDDSRAEMAEEHSVRAKYI